MEELTLKSKIIVCKKNELAKEEQQLVDTAIRQTDSSYAPHSHFCVGAALLLENGTIVEGCNQENAVFPAGICAERSAIFSAGAQYPNEPVVAIAVAARSPEGKLTEDPVSPCGVCRQVLVETETRFQHPVKILLYGQKHIFVIEGVSKLLPLTFKEF
ncbi:cytidine deaminase [Prevotella sp. E9-3]|uniref:cytidine deaminase n=1 Tax=Prevotella sp. E9-3 TaxID=2913621 RepID=UPI001EDA3EAE|nr:cytidine deaminase [Prevotella sp. E9-3]UKK49578.1 cytidine deaminase [Prevotella sp. E9-3]